jgi:seryl-tRNA(Sec) selenium transferase
MNLSMIANRAAAMKFEPHLPQLPSLGELLEHPRVKGVVTRINRSTLAHRAAGFLDELRSSLVERAGKIEIPPVGQIAERLARRLLGEPISAGPIINATGVVIGDPALVPPLADAAVHAMAQVASEYHGSSAHLDAACSELLCELCGAEAALVASSFDGAMALLTANKGQACSVDATPLAGLINPGQYGFESFDTVSDRLAAGAYVVIADGAGLLGGPSCGIMIGKPAFIEAAAQHSLAPLVTASSVTLAGLHATLSAYKNNKESVPYTIPVWQLLSAPPANWKQRAERLAPLIAAIAGVASAEPREAQSAWRAGSGGDSQAASWAIDVRPNKIDAAALAQRLEHQPTSVKATVVEDAVRLDLRGVFPRWDQQLVSAVEKALSED